MAKNSRSVARVHRHARVRKKLMGTAERPRLNVFRSLSAIYAQLIDDQTGHTLLSASTVDHELREKMKGLKKADKQNWSVRLWLNVPKVKEFRQSCSIAVVIAILDASRRSQMGRAK